MRKRASRVSEKWDMAAVSISFLMIADAAERDLRN